jgi:hypothetical protein
VDCVPSRIVVAEFRSDNATVVTCGGVGDDVRRSSFDCSFKDHSLALSLIPEKILGTRIFLLQSRRFESLSSDGGVFLGVLNSSSNTRRPSTPLLPSLFVSASSTRSIHSHTITALPIAPIDRIY